VRIFKHSKYTTRPGLNAGLFVYFMEDALPCCATGGGLGEIRPPVVPPQAVGRFIDGGLGGKIPHHRCGCTDISKVHRKGMSA